jgi:hypothetical protein
MPRYYYHVRRGQLTVLDHEGIELADNLDAEAEAAERAQRLANGDAMNGASMNGASMNEASASRGTIIVADDNWQRLFEVPF